jgi:transketolase
MKDDETVFFLTADMGINLVERIQDAFPDRYSNVGIAEQNLIGIGAGLCNAGFRPFLYTISNFLVHRCLEQVRNDIVMHKYPAVLLGTSTGFDNAPLGPTHHIIDDWGTMASIPDIDIYCPSGVDYADSLVDRVLSENRPAYVRIPKGQPQVPGGASDAFLIEGKRRQVLLVSYGTPVQECLGVQGARDDVSVLILNRLRPLDEHTVENALRQHKYIISVEDHRAESGLYGQLCRFCMERRLFVDLRGLGVRPGYPLDIGASSSYYHKLCGIDTEGILRTIDEFSSGSGIKLRVA